VVDAVLLLLAVQQAPPLPMLLGLHLPLLPLRVPLPLPLPMPMPLPRPLPFERRELVLEEGGLGAQPLVLPAHLPQAPLRSTAQHGTARRAQRRVGWGARERWAQGW
jgi:hypothetical protein